MRIKDLSVVKKISVSYLTVFAVFGLVSVMLVQGLLTLNKDISVLTDKSLPSVAILKGIQVDITKVRKDEFSLLPNANHPKIGEWLKGLDQWRSDVQAGIAEYESSTLISVKRSLLTFLKKPGINTSKKRRLTTHC